MQFSRQPSSQTRFQDDRKRKLYPSTFFMLCTMAFTQHTNQIKDIYLIQKQGVFLSTLIMFCTKQCFGCQNILKAKSNFTLLLYIPFLGIGEWYFKCV